MNNIDYMYQKIQELELTVQLLDDRCSDLEEQLSRKKDKSPEYEYREHR